MGEFPDSFSPLPTSEGVFVNVHWNDGPVSCDAATGACHGFLEVRLRRSTLLEYYALARRPANAVVNVAVAMPLRVTL